MRIDIVTCLPSLLESPLRHFTFQRARQKGLLSLEVHNLRDYTPYKRGKIDDQPYGGEAGMVLMVEPIANCLRALQAQRHYDEIIYMAPDGQKIDQALINGCSLKQNLAIVCGHYKGIDERIRTHFITLELSVGDYVVSGGELPALLFADAIVRVLPGVLSDASAALTDSFQDGWIAPPTYTRPANYAGMQVPDVLLSGNHQAIQTWAHQEAAKRTQERRPHLMENVPPANTQEPS